MSEIPSNVAPVAPAPEPAPAPAQVVLPAPAVEAPAAVVAPPVVRDSAPALIEPVAEPAAVEGVPEPAVEPALKLHTESEPGLLGQPEAPKPDAEVKPADGAPVVETEPVAEAPITYEAPTLPDGVALDAERLGAADTVFRELGLKGEDRQRLIDMYVAERQQDAARTLQGQHDAFAEVKRAWRETAMSDEEIGGAALRTSVESANRAITAFTTDKTRQPFMDMLTASGLDSHPEMIRFLNYVDRRFSEPAIAPLPRGPTSDNGRRSPQGQRAQARDFYDNPRSQEVARR